MVARRLDCLNILSWPALWTFGQVESHGLTFLQKLAKTRPASIAEEVRQTGRNQPVHSTSPQ